MKIHKTLFCPKCKPARVMFNMSSVLGLSLRIMNFKCEKCGTTSSLKLEDT